MTPSLLDLAQAVLVPVNAFTHSVVARAAGHMPLVQIGRIIPPYGRCARQEANRISECTNLRMDGQTNGRTGRRGGGGSFRFQDSVSEFERSECM